MKLGDMTFKQIAEICASHNCIDCPFHKKGFNLSCRILRDVPSHQDLSMKVNTDAED